MTDKQWKRILIPILRIIAAVFLIFVLPRLSPRKRKPGSGQRHRSKHKGRAKVPSRAMSLPSPDHATAQLDEHWDHHVEAMTDWASSNRSVRKSLPSRWSSPLIVVISSLVAGLGGFVASLEFSTARLVLGVAGALALPLLLLHVDAGVLILLGLLWARVSDVAILFHGAPSIVTPLVALLIVAWVGRKAVHGEPLHLTVFDSLVPILPYLTVVCLSVAWSEYQDSAASSILIVLKDVMLFWLLTTVIAEFRLMQSAFYIVVVACACLSLVGVHQYVTGNYASNYAGFAQSEILNIVGDVDADRLGGPMNSPNAFALILVIGVALGMSLVRMRRTWLSWLVTSALVGAIVPGILLTYSRSCILLLGLVMALVIPWRRARVSHLMIALAILVTAAVLAPPHLWQRLETLVAPVIGTGEAGVLVDTSIELRVGAQAAAFEMFMTHPLLGVGSGNYAELYQDYTRLLGLRSLSGPYAPHNRYLEVMAETGIVGLMAFLLMVIVPYRRLRRTRLVLEATSEKEGPERELLLGLEIALATYVVAMSFTHGDYPRYFWMLLALVLAAARPLAAPAPGAALVIVPRESTEAEPMERSTREKLRVVGGSP